MFWDSLLDALIDTAKVLPILLLVYLLLAYFEHQRGEKYQKFLNFSKKAGPVVGAVLGSFPQCGFSSVMSDLYSKKSITIGTLIAVFIATSDEAIPIMIANTDFIVPMLILIAIKFVWALLIGYGIDLILKLFNRKKLIVNEIKDDCVHHEHEHEHEHDHNHCCADNVFIEAIKHTLSISLFLFVATLVINLIIGAWGIEGVSAMFGDNIYAQCFIAGLIGLIPNCAASVFLVEFFMAGGLSFGALVGGLSVGAGIGYLVLFKNNKKIWENLIIIGITYVIGTLLGVLVNLFGILI